MMAEDWLAELVALERRIVVYDESPPEGESGMAILEGDLPVLVSAPHSARHLRSARWKREDEYTAALAHWLHARLGVHALYASHRLAPDPHDDGDAGDYKRLAAEIVTRHAIRLVLDLHGARGDRDFALALGTIYGQTCAPYEAPIIAALGEIGLETNGPASSLDRLALNPRRYAGGSHRPTVTRYLWQTTGVAALQLEINAWVRVVERLPTSYAALNGEAPDFRGDPARIRRTLDGLLRIVALV